MASWKNSKARTLLYRDLLDDKISLSGREMNTRTVFLQRIEFVDSGWEDFSKRLKDLRKQVKKEKEDDGSNYKWSGSEAKRLLKNDLMNGVISLDETR